MSERAEARKTCTSHCTTCGAHFHGDSAFDAHRRDGQCMNPETATSLKGRRLLQVWAAEGFCDKELGCWVDGKRDHYVTPVIVWQQADKAFGNARGIPVSEARAAVSVQGALLP